MKSITFKCSKTVKKGSRNVRCNRFLCEISDKITLVCRKCGAEYALTQEKDGRWILAISIKSVLKVNLKKELDHETK